MLPIAEILFEGLEANAPKIVDFDAKWTPDSAAYIGTPRRFGLERNEPELAKKLKQFALASWNLFGLNGYARFDFRVDPTGKPFVIDVNPNPYLASRCGLRCGSGRGWALLPGLDRQNRESSLASRNHGSRSKRRSFIEFQKLDKQRELSCRS